jgi:UDP-N-acetylmuramoylalanine--D-glutamate ligase
MDRYDSFADYTAMKSRVYSSAKISVVNSDDALVMAMPVQGEVKTFSVVQEPSAGQYGLHEAELACGTECLLPISKLKLQGRHNYANALAALALGDAIELPRAAMLSALVDFAGLEHRTQWVAEQDSVVYINDSKATNVGATAAAVLGMEQQQVLIAGGVGKDQDFSPLQQVLAGRVRHTILIGQDADKLEQAIHSTCSTSMAKDMQDAVDQAQTKALAGDIVLLSPACASFDMYSGFEARGADFIACVHGLAGGQA